MRKKLLSVALIVLCAALTLCGCVVVNEERDMAQVVAKVGDRTITKGEVVQKFNDAGYPSYLEQYGYTAGTDEYNEAALSSLTALLDSMVQTELQLQAATAAGVTLDETETQEVEDSFQSTLTSITDSARTEAETLAAEDDSIDVEAKTQELVDKNFTDAGYTQESYKQELTNQAIVEKYKEQTLESVQLTDEEIATQYAELQTTQRTEYVGATGTPDAPEEGKDITSTGVEDDYKSGTVGYMPGNFVAVTNLLIQFDSETQTAITDLEANEELSEEEKATQKAALQEAGYAGIQEKAEELLAQAKETDKEGFKTLIEENGEDTGMTGDSLEYGYLTGENTSFVQSFLDAALAFTEVGQVSELVPSEYGYHILRCEAVFAPGDVPLEQVRDRYQAEANETYQEEYYTQHLEQLETDKGVQTYPDRLKLNS